MMRLNHSDLQIPDSRITAPNHLEPRSKRKHSPLSHSVESVERSAFTVSKSGVEQAQVHRTNPIESKVKADWVAERSTPDASDLLPDLENSNPGNEVYIQPPAVTRQNDSSTLSNGNQGNGNGGAQGVDSSGNGSGKDESEANGSGESSESADQTCENLEADAAEPGLLPVLKNRNFLTLWSGQVFSQLADKVYLVLMIALIASRFQAVDQTISGWVSSLMIAFTIPAILFGSIAGVFVDHWRKRAVLVATNLLRGGLVLSLPLLLWLTHGLKPLMGLPVGFLVLLGVTFLVSTLTQFFAPAEQAVIPLIVERRHLLSANSLYTMTMMASVIIGFALGEPLLELANQLLAPLSNQLNSPDFGKELLVGGSYAIAGVLLMLLKTNERTVDSDETLPDVWKNISDGLRYLKEQRHVRVAMIHLVILFSIFAALAVLAVRLAEIMPEIKSSQFGFLLAAGGVGMAIGAVLVGQFGQRFSRAQLSFYGSIGMAVALAAVSCFTQHLFPTLPLLVLLGACAAIAGVPMQTSIQEETPEEMRGKVFGLQNNAINIALSLPLALAGIAETLFGLQVVFLGLAGLALAGGFLTWSLSRAQNNQNLS